MGSVIPSYEENWVTLPLMLTKNGYSLQRQQKFFNEKALGETQTLPAGSSKAEPKIFGPPQTPFAGAHGPLKFNQLEMVTYLYLQTQFGEDQCKQFRVIVVTDPQTHAARPPQTGPITIHCAAKLSAQCNNHETQ